jgi:hypothetical protein
MVMDWSRGMAMVEGNRNGGMVMDWSRGMAMVEGNRNGNSVLRLSWLMPPV